MSDHRAAQIQAITDAVNNLTESPLYAFRVESDYHAVIGSGDLNASIMFIGEAPGENEAKKGKPFVGASGRVLDELLASIGLERESVYITNIVKDRPPNNRDPHKKEIKLYSPFLEQQIDIIQPKVIAPLGRFSMDFILNLFDVPEKTQKITALHGKRIKAQASYGEIDIVPLYHPAVALYTAAQKDTLLEDFQTLKAFVSS